MKILLTVFIFSISATAFAQTQKNQLPYPNGVSVRVMSVEEANQLNGVAHPTIDGIPYEQYKAQQESLKAQAAAKQAAAANNPGGLTLSKNAPVAATQAPVTETPASTASAKPAAPVEVTIPLKQVPLGRVAKPQQQ